MPNYRRAKVKGGTYFFTVNILDRKSGLLTRHINELRQSFNHVKKQLPFKLDALVILPDHFHMVMTLPQNDDDYSNRLRLIKEGFTKRLNLNAIDHISRITRNEKGVWQRRFWEHQIRDEEDYINHIHYCYINPVKHQWVKRVRDWPYSTFHRDGKRGLFSIDWAGCGEFEGRFGEV
ncbi:transposase [Kangiella sp.]|uniref:REP-associated tyrosine transposase n=1 Tax=Kangiella sp. TaxID=1920245 RepID=UPI0019B54A4D|nr:transposase [Kangiella sp.]MBD3654075.1 transposase [Kangiella sp.]